jgi:hypothetical protein
MFNDDIVGDVDKKQQQISTRKLPSKMLPRNPKANETRIKHHLKHEIVPPCNSCQPEELRMIAARDWALKRNDQGSFA